MKLIILTLTFVLFVIPLGISQTLGTSIDQNSNSFTWKKIGNQYWSTINTNVESYRDGTPIPQVTDASEWVNLTTGAWCYYNNDTTKGKLYNWYAVAGIHDNDENTPNKEFAPEGWNVPTDTEWTTLENYLIANGYNYEGTTTENKIAKSMASITGWNNSTSDGAPGNNQTLNNSSGFNAQAHGFLEITGTFKDYGIGFNSWHSNEDSLDDSKYFRIASYNNFTGSPITFKQEGLSVRFVSSNPSSILLNGTVSAESNQIKNVADPTDAQDAATKSYVDSNVNAFSGSYNDLADKPAATYTQAQVDALIQNLQTQIDGLTSPQGTAAINHNNKTYSGVSCEGFWLGFKFSVSETQTITALGAWDEGHNIDVNDEFSSCPDASNFSVPIAIYKNDVLVLEKVINASTGFVVGNSRYIEVDDFVLTPGDEYFIIGNYEGSSKFGYYDSNLVSSNYDSRITPLTVTSSPLFSRNTNGDGTFPSNLTTLSDNQWSDQYFHVNFLLKN
tara:strand:+ start:133 stop:1641 length:1509 start_codon:yes stop_codon:yes gene_type:complete